MIMPLSICWPGTPVAAATTTTPTLKTIHLQDLFTAMEPDIVLSYLPLDDIYRLLACSQAMQAMCFEMLYRFASEVDAAIDYKYRLMGGEWPREGDMREAVRDGHHNVGLE